MLLSDIQLELNIQTDIRNSYDSALFQPSMCFDSPSCDFLLYRWRIAFICYSLLHSLLVMLKEKSIPVFRAMLSFFRL